MPEHLIRLRGPWELCSSTDSRVEQASVRIALPAEALPDTALPITLRRRFGRPLRSSATLACRLRCESVPGLTAIRLNGIVLLERSAENPISIETIDVSIPNPLQLRNQLELTVLGRAARASTSGPPWGAVVLIFTETDEPASC